MVSYERRNQERNINVEFLKELGSITKEEFVVRSIYCDEVYKDVKDIDRSDINIKRILDIIFINFYYIIKYFS